MTNDQSPRSLVTRSPIDPIIIIIVVVVVVILTILGVAVSRRNRS